MEKFKTIEKDLIYLDETITNNIKIVDQDILPYLRKLLVSISDGKVLTKTLKKQHISLMETEDELHGQLANINQTKASRIKNSCEV